MDAGYNVIIIWENDYLENKQVVIEQLLERLNE